MQRTNSRTGSEPPSGTASPGGDRSPDDEDRTTAHDDDHRTIRDVEDGRTTARDEGRPSTVADEPSGPLLAFFIPDLSTGGAEQVTVNIVNGLAARGYDVELLLSRDAGELRAQLSERVTVVELSPSRTPVFGAAMHLPALVAYLRRRKPAALFPHLEHVNLVGLAATRFLDAETVVVPTQHKTFGTVTDQTPKDRLARTLLTYVYPSADQIVAVSGGVAESIAAGTTVDPGDISVLYNPVEVEAVRERARDPVDHEWIEDDDLEVILFVGRIAPQKDLETWLRAFALIHERHPDTRAVLAGTELDGTGSLRAELLELADRLGIADVVSMPGYVENPYRYMDRASVFLLSSRYEGLPTVLIEALACGCPVVSTDCPSGPREILDDGTFGRLVPVDAVKELADAVEATLTDPPAPDALRTRADDFAPEAVLDEYERFIEENVAPD